MHSSLAQRASGLFLAVLLTLLLGAGPAGAQGIFDDRGERFSFGGVAFPAIADTFVVLDTRRWPNPALGVQLHYASPLDPSARVDVYVYPADADGAEAELGEAVQEILRYTEENRDGVTVTIDTTHALTVTDPGGRAHAGWHAVGRFERQGNERPSLLWVFEKDGLFLKYRVTHAPEQRVRLEPHLRGFLAETLGAIAPAGDGGRDDDGSDR